MTRIIRLPTRDSYATVSRDGTIRVWATHSGLALQRKATVGTAYLTVGRCRLTPGRPWVERAWYSA